MFLLNSSYERADFIISAQNDVIPANFRSVSHGDLCVSASQQPSEHGISWIFQKALMEGKSLHVVDLREESHFFVNGHSITHYNGVDNNDNRGLSLEEIHAKEGQMIEEIQLQASVSVFGERKKVVTGPKVVIDGVVQKNKNKRLELGDKQDLVITDIKTEAEYIRSLEGAEYTRIPFTDHLIDEMISQLDKVVHIIKMAIEKRDVWVHFHCHGGKGRAAVALLTSHVFMQKHLGASPKEIIECLVADDRFKNERKKYANSPTSLTENIEMVVSCS